MKRLALLLLFLAPDAARAQQGSDFFSARPVTYQEKEEDLRFVRSKIAQGLASTPKNPACARVIATLLSAYAEAAPFFHKRDERFWMIPALIRPITTERFPGERYLRLMVRRTILDGRAPADWLNTARELKRKYDAPIDLSRMKYAVDGPLLIDSVFFGVVPLLNRFREEVALAPSAGMEQALQRFHAKYLDRDVAWWGVTLEDIQSLPAKALEPMEGLGKPKGAKTKASKTIVIPPAKPKSVLVAAFSIAPSYPSNKDPWKYEWGFDPEVVAELSRLQLFESPQPVAPRIMAQLAEKQYRDNIKLIPTQKKYLVRGRLRDLRLEPSEESGTTMMIDLSDGVIFDDHDWTAFKSFASGDDVRHCELCIDEVS
jgi:hypothetical protein